MLNRIPITAEGAAKLKAELEYLKKTARPQVVAAIAEAREKGDLSENAEYDAAREEQSHIEGRIAELEGKIPAPSFLRRLPKGALGAPTHQDFAIAAFFVVRVRFGRARRGASATFFFFSPGFFDATFLAGFAATAFLG